MKNLEFFLLLRARPTDTKVKSGTSKSKSGTSGNVSNSGDVLRMGPSGANGGERLEGDPQGGHHTPDRSQGMCTVRPFGETGVSLWMCTVRPFGEREASFTPETLLALTVPSEL